MKVHLLDKIVINNLIINQYRWLNLKRQQLNIRYFETATIDRHSDLNAIINT